MNWTNFISRLYFKMYFLFYAYAFDDIMKFEYITQILKFDFVKNKKSF